MTRAFVSCMVTGDDTFDLQECDKCFLKQKMTSREKYNHVRKVRRFYKKHRCKQLSDKAPAAEKIVCTLSVEMVLGTCRIQDVESPM